MTNTRAMTRQETKMATTAISHTGKVSDIAPGHRHTQPHIATHTRPVQANFVWSGQEVGVA